MVIANGPSDGYVIGTNLAPQLGKLEIGGWNRSHLA
jgi:hypothetical protein